MRVIPFSNRSRLQSASFYVRNHQVYHVRDIIIIYRRTSHGGPFAVEPVQWSLTLLTSDLKHSPCLGKRERILDPLNLSTHHSFVYHSNLIKHAFYHIH